MMLLFPLEIRKEIIETEKGNIDVFNNAIKVKDTFFSLWKQWFYFIFCYRNCLYLKHLYDKRLCYKHLIKLFIQTWP